jgi:large conductance mechanosensitive channel
MRKKLVGKKAKQIKNELKEGVESLVGKKEYDQFKKFAFKGHMIQMAIAFMMGAAFNSVIKSISENLIMPVINFGLSKTGEDWRQFTYMPTEGLTLEIGKFCSAFVDFFLISLVLYIFYVKLLKPIWEEKPEIKCIETKKCLVCQSVIHWQCERCPQCTTWLEKIGK